jgi:hypothetical protein
VESNKIKMPKHLRFEKEMEVNKIIKTSKETS